MEEWYSVYNEWKANNPNVVLQFEDLDRAQFSDWSVIPLKEHNEIDGLDVKPLEYGLYFRYLYDSFVLEVIII